MYESMVIIMFHAFVPNHDFFLEKCSQKRGQGIYTKCKLTVNVPMVPIELQISENKGNDCVVQCSVKEAQRNHIH